MAMSQVFRVDVTKKGKKVSHVARVGGGSMTEESLGEHYEKLNVFPGADEVYIEELGEVPEVAVTDAIQAGPPRKITPKAKVKNPSEPTPASIPPSETSKGVSLPALGASGASDGSKPAAAPVGAANPSTASSPVGRQVIPPINPASK